MIIKIILIVLCLIFSALFSGSEIVYSKVNKLKLARDAANGNTKSKRALDIANDFSKTITTILIGNNLVNIALSSVAAVLAIDIAGELIPSESLLTIITAIVVTIIVLIFGEILPKTISQNFSYSLSRLLVDFISILSFVFYPLIFLINKAVGVLNKPFRKLQHRAQEDDQIDDELITMTEVLEESGVIDEDDAELIKSAIDFTDTLAWEIMVPRVDVVAYNIEDGFDNIIKDQHFFDNSRVPLYNETIDNILGIIDTTLVLKRILSKETVNLSDVLFEPLYVHKTKPITSVLNELKNSHKHLAIVLDEWGGMMGILTMEDILEELFGEIWDETDVVELEYKEVGDNVYVVDGDMNINDFFDLIDYDDRNFDSEYSTVGGWCTEVLERFPETGDLFNFENYEILILLVDGRRVNQIQVTIKIDDLNKE